MSIIEVAEKLNLGNLKSSAVTKDKIGFTRFGRNEFSVGGKVDDVCFLF